MFFPFKMDTIVIDIKNIVTTQCDVDVLRTILNIFNETGSFSFLPEDVINRTNILVVRIQVFATIKELNTIFTDYSNLYCDVVEHNIPSTSTMDENSIRHVIGTKMSFIHRHIRSERTIYVDDITVSSFQRVTPEE